MSAKDCDSPETAAEHPSNPEQEHRFAAKVEDDAAGATAAAKTEALSSDARPSLSKSQLKKIRRWERKVEAKERRKQHEKEVRLARARAEGRDLEAERRFVEQRTAEGAGKRRRIQHFQEEKMKHAQASFQVCVDCAFEDRMTDREICSLAKQLRYCYSTNRSNRKPSILSLTSLSGKTLGHLQNVSGYEEWMTYAFVPTEQPLEQHFADRLSDVVYLTSDSPATLTQLDNSKIYVIGGIVDRNRIKGATLKRANALGVATAKLPLDQHLKAMESTRVLLVNHVFEILLKCKEFEGDWRRALEAVIPQRKHAEFVGEGNDEEASAGGATEAVTKVNPQASATSSTMDASSQQGSVS